MRRSSSGRRPAAAGTCRSADSASARQIRSHGRIRALRSGRARGRSARARSAPAHRPEHRGPFGGGVADAVRHQPSGAKYSTRSVPSDSMKYTRRQPFVTSPLMGSGAAASRRRSPLPRRCSVSDNWNRDRSRSLRPESFRQNLAELLQRVHRHDRSTSPRRRKTHPNRQSCGTLAEPKTKWPSRLLTRRRSTTR